MYSTLDLFKLQKYRVTLKTSLESKKECGIWERFHFERNLRSAINNRLHCRSSLKPLKNLSMTPNSMTKIIRLHPYMRLFLTLDFNH